MRVPTSLGRVLCAFALVLPAGVAQEVLHYDFRAGKGTTAANLARGPIAGPSTGTFRATQSKLWHTGRFDSATAGSDIPTTKALYAYVDTGWRGRLKGSFTLSWFLRERMAPADFRAHYLFGRGQLRGFLLGRARKGFALAGWGGVEYLTLDKDLFTMTRQGWVHIALVVDDVKKQATFYVDGKPEAPIPLFSAVDIAADSGGFTIGAWEGRLATPSYWSIDELRLQARALTALEVLGLTAVMKSLGKTCGASLGPSGVGNPEIGNLKFQMRLSGPSKKPAVLVLGLAPLVIDLGSVFGKDLEGCDWHVLPWLMLPSLLDDSGKVDHPFPLPADPALIGTTFYQQALVIDGAKKFASNGYMFSVLPKGGKP